MKTCISLLAVFIVASVVTLLGVIFFFKPISELDTSGVAVLPVIGLSIYVGICTIIFHWASSQMNSSYKAAVVLIAPQVALIVDLALRGERGWLTTLAGSALLIITWASAAIVHQLLVRKGVAK